MATTKKRKAPTDKERLDWMQVSGCSAQRLGYDRIWSVYTDVGEFRFRNEDVRAAIDAAMASSKGEL